MLLACALVGVLPVGRHGRQRAAAAPAFAAAAAFAALHEPGVHLLPADPRCRRHLGGRRVEPGQLGGLRAAVAGDDAGAALGSGLRARGCR